MPRLPKLVAVPLLCIAALLVGYLTGAVVEKLSGSGHGSKGVTTVSATATPTAAPTSPRAPTRAP